MQRRWRGQGVARQVCASGLSSRNECKVLKAVLLKLAEKGTHLHDWHRKKYLEAITCIDVSSQTSSLRGRGALYLAKAVSTMFEFSGL